MHDGIAFETAGKPATTVVTQTFVPLARAKRTSMNLEEYRFIVVPHPLITLHGGSGLLEAPAGEKNQAEIKAKVQAAAPEVVKALIGG